MFFKKLIGCFGVCVMMVAALAAMPFLLKMGAGLLGEVLPELRLTGGVSLEEGWVDTEEEAAEILRQGMKERVPSIEIDYVVGEASVDLTEADLEKLAVGIFDEALAHTGDPEEGDSLDYRGYEYAYELIQEGQKDDAVELAYKVEYGVSKEQDAEFDAAVDALLAKLDMGKDSDYEKIRKIYDYICDGITYDYDHLEDEAYTLKYTAYAALINKTAVCEGYAELFYRLALESGIDARVIYGESQGESHAWNIVQLDGVYYNVDATWDSVSGGYYQYFLRCEENFSDHARNMEYRTTEFYEAYPMAVEDYED